MLNNILNAITDQIVKLVSDPKSLSAIGGATLAALATTVGRSAWNCLRYAWRTRDAYDVTGHWIGECYLESYKDKRALEIWRYSRRGDELKLKFFAYMPGDNNVSKWLGGGVWRGTMLSGYYYRKDRFTFESGVIALKQEGLALKGAYAQFDLDTARAPLNVSEPTYTQTRIRDLSRSARLKMFFGCKPFKTYEEVRDAYGGIVVAASPTKKAP